MHQMTKWLKFTLLLAAALLWSGAAGAATQVRSPSGNGDCNNVGGIGSQSWSNEDNAVSNNGNDATVSVNDNQVSNYLRCLNYGFSIPTGAVINGIVVSIDRSASNTNAVADAAVRLVKGGAIGATDRSTGTTYPTSDAYEDHGTATDLWGTTWTAAQINAANFGVAFAVQKITNSGGNRTVRVDHIEITVYYTPVPSVVSINRASTNPTGPATAVAWTVVFDQSVTGVNAADFVLVQTGVTGASITSVTGSGTTWTVNANTGSNAGTVGLNLVDDDTIVNGSGVALGGSGAGNGNFTGQVYTISGPSVVSMVRANSSPTGGATSVSWTVTFDRTVTGVNSADFTLVAGGGVSGATITAVTGSGSTRTVTASNWTGTGTLGLNLVDDDTIVDGAGLRLGGTGVGNGNFTGEVYTISAAFCSPPANTPAGLALTCVCDTFGRSNLNPSTILGGTWALSNSDGISNPYINATSGYLRLTENTGNNAKAATVPAIFPAAGNYISVEFNNYAYNGSGADGIAVTLSDYLVPAVPGGYGGSLGYAPNSNGSQPPGFAGGWIGVALDEYGNYQNPTEGRTLGPGFIVQSVGVRGPGSGNNGYRWMGGTGANPGGIGIDNRSSSTPAPGHMFQVIVDARAYASNIINVNVNRDTTTRDGSSYTSLFGPFNAYTEANHALGQGWISQLVPDYWKVSFTGSTGGSTNIHEIGSLRICAQTVYPATGGTASGFSVIDEAYPAGAGSTVPAYPNFSTGDIYMKLAGTPFKLWVAALTGTGISGGYSAVSNKYLQVKLVDNTDNACGTDAARTCNATCTGKAAVETGASQVMTMTNADPGAKLSSNFSLNSSYKNLLAIVRECTSSACSSFTSTAAACSADSLSVRPTSVASVISSANNGGSGGTPIFKAGGDNFTMTATTTGVAGFPSKYSGVLKINTATLQAVGAAGNVVGALSPNTFAAAVSATPSSTATGSTFTYSEVGAFRLPGFVPSVTGTAGNDTSPRGVFDGVSTASECTTPGLTVPQCDTLRAATWTGVDSVSTKANCVLDSYSNVKVNGKYGCSFGNLANTATIGRFVPDHFDTYVTGGTACPTGLTCPCPVGSVCPPASFNGFVYSGQPFTTNVIARNASGATTTNYDSGRGYARTVTLSAWDASGSTTTQNPPGGGSAGSFAVGTSTVASSSFSLGSTVGGTPAAPNYSLPNIYPSATPPPGPTDIFMRAIDPDGTTSLRGAASVENGIKIVSGRITMSNAHGSELQQLPIGVTAQYWNGTRYVTSDTHSFSMPVASVLFGNCMKNLSASGACKPAPVVDIVTPPNPVVISNGVGSFKMRAPGTGNSGSADLTISLFPYLPSTTNRATFGIYKAGPIIYIREMY